jgi:hypothetical protein
LIRPVDASSSMVFFQVAHPALHATRLARPTRQTGRGRRAHPCTVAHVPHRHPGRGEEPAQLRRTLHGRGLGCGTGCVAHAIVDARTGAVFHPPQFSSTDNDNLDYDEVSKPDGETVKFRLDSKLLVVIGGVNEDPALRGVSYFLWDKNRLRRMRFVHRPYDAKATAPRPSSNAAK